MKYKAVLLGLSGLVFLGGCNFSQTESNPIEDDTVSAETETSNSLEKASSDEEPAVSDEKPALLVFDELVEEHDFSNRHGYQA